MSTPRGGSSRCSASCISGAEATWRGCPVACSSPARFNSIRSPMAAALLRQLHGRPHLCRFRRRAHGAGRSFRGRRDGRDRHRYQGSPGRRASTSSRTPPSISSISLSPEAQHTAVELTRSMACDVEFWPVLDPTGVEGSREETLAAYRIVRDQLQKRILERFPPAPTEMGGI